MPYYDFDWWDIDWNYKVKIRKKCFIDTSELKAAIERSSKPKYINLIDFFNDLFIP